MYFLTVCCSVVPVSALTPKQTQLLEAMQEGASLRYAGWQQINVTFGPADKRNYVARIQTLIALNDRGLVRIDQHGPRLTDDGRRQR